MKRSTHLITALAYYYAQIFGILNFSFDWRRQRAYKNTAITVYAVTLNVLYFTIIPYFVLTLELKSRSAGSATVIYRLTTILILIRIAAVLTTVVFNWTKRSDFIRLINSYQKFCQELLQKCGKKQKFAEYLERGMRQKLRSSMVMDSILYCSCFHIFRNIFEISSVWIAMGLAVIPTILNAVTLHYYIALLNVNACLSIIYDELERVLKESKEYELMMATGRQSQTYLGYLEKLSDYINYLASCVLRLQNYVKRIGNIYEVQSVCCTLILYLSNVLTIYINFMTSAPENLWNQKNSLRGILTLFVVFLYYYDLKYFIYSMLDAVDWVQKLGNLLKQEQVHLPFQGKTIERIVNIRKFSFSYYTVRYYELKKKTICFVFFFLVQQFFFTSGCFTLRNRFSRSI